VNHFLAGNVLPRVSPGAAEVRLTLMRMDSVEPAIRILLEVGVPRRSHHGNHLCDSVSVA
jgi:hypothetical protein